MLYTNTECMQTAGSNVIDRQSVCADQWSSSESNTEVFCRCSASSENTRVRGRMSGRKRIITWFSLAEDSMNAAFHDSAKALPSSQLMTLRETHIYSFKYRLHIKVHTNLHSFHLFYKKRNLSEIKKKSLVQELNKWMTEQYELNRIPDGDRKLRGSMHCRSHTRNTRYTRKLHHQPLRQCVLFAFL